MCHHNPQLTSSYTLGTIPMPSPSSEGRTSHWLTATCYDGSYVCRDHHIPALLWEHVISHAPFDSSDFSPVVNSPVHSCPQGPVTRHLGFQGQKQTSEFLPSLQNMRKPKPQRDPGGWMFVVSQAGGHSPNLFLLPQQSQGYGRNPLWRCNLQSGGGSPPPFCDAHNIAKDAE